MKAYILIKYMPDSSAVSSKIYKVFLNRRKAEEEAEKEKERMDEEYAEYELEPQGKPTIDIQEFEVIE
jgi:hypothetical protein